jgi:hypothetical protein
MATLTDAQLSEIRGSAPSIVVTQPVEEAPTFFVSNGTPANSNPALARVNAAPCPWAIYSNNFMTSQENGPLALLIGNAELGRRLQHYTYTNPVKGYAEQVNGVWHYQYQPTGTDAWLPWSGPGDPPGQVPYGS